MTRWRLIVDDGASAAGGLATDESLMRGYWGDDPPPPTLRLYTYRSHCALVGRFQDPHAELNLDACAATGTQVNRRPTGGGAIIMGREQLGVALVTTLRDPATPSHPRAIIDTFAAGILQGLLRLGVRGELRGKNDIAVNGRKIAGLGIYIDTHDAVLFHASVLAGLDVGFMLSVLNIPAAKLSGAAAASVAERITTASRERGAAVSVGDLRICVEGGFEEAFGIHTERRPLSVAETAVAREVQAGRYDRSDWVFGRASVAPEGAAVLKTPGGLLRIECRLAGDAIKDVFVAGDFMARERSVAEIEAALRWVAADRIRVSAAVAEGWTRGGGLDGVSPEELAEAIWSAVADARARRGMTGSCYYPPVSEKATVHGGEH